MCEFEISVGNYYYRCPVPTGNYCFWHEEVKGKRIDSNRIEELRNYNIQWAYLEEAKFVERNLRGIKLRYANLKGANLSFCDLQNAYLRNADLKGANLREAQLQNADLVHADLSGVNLKWAKVHGAKFWYAKLIGTNLYGVIADEETRFDFANLTCANLNGAYLHRSMTLRESKIFKYCKKDIYELTGDYIKYSNRKFYSYLDSFKRYGFKRYVSDKCNKIKKTPLYSNLVVLDVDEIRRRDFELAKRLYNEGLVKYITRVETDDAIDYPIVFFDKNSKKAVRIPELENIEDLREEIPDFENYVDIPELENYVECTFNEDKKFLYDVSHYVYSSLYNFLISSGKVDDALKAHVRENEVYRKLLKEKRNLIPYCLHTILKYLTGYGVGVKRALSLLLLLLVVKLCKSLHGFLSIIVRFNKFLDPNLLGIWEIFKPYSMLIINLINLAANAIEGLEAFILALVIFVITYRISR